jgi:hypothetical protein
MLLFGIIAEKAYRGWTIAIIENDQSGSTNEKKQANFSRSIYRAKTSR